LLAGTDSRSITGNTSVSDLRISWTLPKMVPLTVVNGAYWPIRLSTHQWTPFMVNPLFEWDRSALSGRLKTSLFAPKLSYLLLSQTKWKSKCIKRF
jgi:hypothetical protein